MKRFSVQRDRGKGGTGRGKDYLILLKKVLSPGLKRTEVAVKLKIPAEIIVIPMSQKWTGLASAMILKIEIQTPKVESITQYFRISADLVEGVFSTGSFIKANRSAKAAINELDKLKI